MMESQLQGNICTCGNVWFSVIMPESNPSRCPFCAKALDGGEPYNSMSEESDEFRESEYQRLVENPNDASYKKATGQSNISLVSKICKFCTNELFFDAIDSEKAKYCPYCDDELVTPAEFFHVTGMPSDPDINSQIMDDLEINELMDTEVTILKKSFNPFVREQQYIFKGLDYITMILKVINKTNNTTEWIPFDSVKYIKKSNDL